MHRKPWLETLSHYPCGTSYQRARGRLFFFWSMYLFCSLFDGPFFCKKKKGGGGTKLRLEEGTYQPGKQME